MLSKSIFANNHQTIERAKAATEETQIAKKYFDSFGYFNKSIIVDLEGRLVECQTQQGTRLTSRRALATMEVGVYHCDNCETNKHKVVAPGTLHITTCNGE